MRLQIISPKKVLFDGECTMVEYNTTEGYVGVLPGHVALTQVIAPGKLVVYEQNKEKPFLAALHSGVVKIMPDVVMILAEVCELKEEIDVERAKKAKERALHWFEVRDEKFNYERTTRSLKRAETRLEVASL